MSVTYDQIEAAEAQLSDLQDGYLRRWGWKSTCSTPGSYWLWARDWSADDAAQLALWHERNDARRLEIERQGYPSTPNSPRPPAGYGSACVPKDMAIQMTLRALDGREELGICDD